MKNIGRREGRILIGEEEEYWVERRRNMGRGEGGIFVVEKEEY